MWLPGEVIEEAVVVVARIGSHDEHDWRIGNYDLSGKCRLFQGSILMLEGVDVGCSSH